MKLRMEWQSWEKINEISLFVKKINFNWIINLHVKPRSSRRNTEHPEFRLGKYVLGHDPLKWKTSVFWKALPENKYTSHRQKIYKIHLW